MTCIIGLVAEGRVWIAGDSQGTAGHHTVARADKKVFVSGKFAMGFTTSYRMGQLLRYKFTPPPMVEGKDLFEYMVCDFAEGIRTVFGDGGFKRTKDGEDTGGQFLVGFRGRLFAIEDDFQVAEFLWPFAAVGSGYAYALGAMENTAHLSASDRLLTALKTAARFNRTVGGPFDVVSVPAPDGEVATDG